MKPKYLRIAGIALMTLAISAVYLMSANQTSGDSRWSLPLAMSIIKEGAANLDAYRTQFKKRDFRIEEVRGHYYTIFPVGASLMAAPFVWSADALLHASWFQAFTRAVRGRSISPDAALTHYPRMEMYIASVLTALSALFLFLWIEQLSTWSTALLLTLVYAFGTSAWSTSSRALWQHAPSILCIALALYLLERARGNQKFLAWAGFVCALTYIMRPTNSIVIVALSSYVLYTARRASWKFFAGAAPVAIAFAAYNFHIYGALLSAYYLPQRLGTNPHFFEALLGDLVSPARGIFIFSPIFIFSCVGVYMTIKNRAWNAFDSACAAIIVFHWIAIASFIHWWGGHSFGPRFFTDVTPFFIYFLIPAVAALDKTLGIRRAAYGAVFCSALLASFLIHGVGANLWSAVLWNATPVSVDEAPARLWDWHDLQFLRW